MIEAQVGARLKALRVAHGLKQTDLLEVLRLNDRQSVSDIETGNRKMSAAELVRIAERFDVSLDDLTNPFLLSAKDSFSWRQNHVPSADLDAFEKRAGEWIGAFRELKRLNGESLKLFRHGIGLTHSSSFEEAVLAGEQAGVELELGRAPARALSDVLESKLGVLVLMVDAIPGVSGAACHLSEMDAILINRNDTQGRRNSDLAHEFFHLLTWNQMKPQRVESSIESWDAMRTKSQERNQRIEQLADNFACGLLMPSSELDRIGQPAANVNLVDWLTAAARELGVSSRALKWRLVNSKRLPEAKAVSNQDLAEAAANQFAADEPPLRFSRLFIQTIGRAVEGGHLSANRAAKLVDMSKRELCDLFEAYGIERPEEL